MTNEGALLTTNPNEVRYSLKTTKKIQIQTQLILRCHGKDLVTLKWCQKKYPKSKFLQNFRK